LNKNPDTEDHVFNVKIKKGCLMKLGRLLIFLAV